MSQFNSIMSHLVSAGVLPEAKPDLNQAHAALAGKAEAVAEALQGAVPPEAILQFVAWVRADDVQAAALQRRLVIFNGVGIPGRVPVEQLEGLLPPHSTIGQDYFGDRADPATFNFNRVAPELSRHGMIFTLNVRGHAILDHAEMRLRQARGDAAFNGLYSGSRNRAEEYLNFIGYLLPKNETQLIAMTEEDIHLVWEMLARVDAERGNADLVINKRLTGIETKAHTFIEAAGLKAMGQLGLAQSDRRVVLGGINAGVGASWTGDITGLVTNPGVAALYQDLRPAFVQEGAEDPEVIKDLDPDVAYSAETLVAWLRINGNVPNMPGTDLVQILRARDAQSYGIDNTAFTVVGGQSAGQVRALGLARAFRTDDSVPFLPVGSGGLQSVEELDRELRFDIREAYWYQYYLPEGQQFGSVVGLAISGIPYTRDSLETSPLGAIVAAINRQCKPGDHIIGGNYTSPEPYYFALMSGTTNALMALRSIIYTFRRQTGVAAKDETPPPFTPESARIARAVAAEVAPHLIGVDPSTVGVPLDSQELGISIPPHDGLVLRPGMDSFVAEMRRRNIVPNNPVTTVISHTTGENLSDIATTQGRDLLAVHAEDNFLLPVWLVELAGGLRDAGVHAVLGYGPTTVAEGYIQKSGVGVPVFPLATDAGRAVMTSRDPRVLEGAMGVVDTEPVFLPGGGVARLDSKGALKVQPGSAAAASGFDGISGVEMTRSDLGNGATQVRVNVRHAVAEADLPRFRAAFAAQGTGTVHDLMVARSLVGPDGTQLVNRLALLATPQVGWVYEWVLGKDGSLTELRIEENNSLSLAVTRDLADPARIVAHDYNYTSHGCSTLDYFYNPIGDGSFVDLNQGPDFRARARAAYRQDWGADAMPEAVRTALAMQPIENFLQDFNLSYSITPTAADIEAYARRVGSGQASPVGFLKDHVLGRLDLLAFLAEGLDLNPVGIRNLGGNEWIAEDANGTPLFQLGQTLTINVNLVAVDDIHEGPRQGRRVKAYVVARDQDGRIVAEGMPTILDLKPNDVPAGSARPVYAPRTDLPTSVDPLKGKKVYTLATPQVVARGPVLVPTKAAEEFTDDEQRLHKSDVSAILGGVYELDSETGHLTSGGLIVQGENYWNRVAEAVVLANSRGDASRYRGFANRAFGVPVKPGDVLEYTVTRLRHGQGLHEYEVSITNAAGDEVATYTHYDRAAQRLFLWPGQGVLQEGYGDTVRSNEARRIFFDALQTSLTGAGYTLDLTSALNTAVRDTASVQPAQAAFLMPYYNDMREQGLVPDDAIHSGLSFGGFMALWASGWVDDQTMMVGAGMRGEEMGALVDETMGMMVVTGFKGSKAEFIRLCADAEAAVLADEGGMAVLSNNNSASMKTASGHLIALNKLVEIINARGVGTASIFTDVQSPFHSPLLAPAAERMKVAIREQRLFDTRTRPVPQRVIMDTTGRLLPNDAEAVTDLYGNQVASPTDMEEVIRYALVELGVREFVEMNGSQNLLRFVYSAARRLGINPDTELTLVLANPDLAPEDWGIVTYDGVKLADAQGASANVDVGTGTGAAAPINPTPLPTPISVPQAQVTGPVEMPVWATPTVAEMRDKQVAWALQLLRNGVSPADVSQDGATPLFQVVAKDAKSLNVDEDAAYRALAVKAGGALNAALDPGALERLEAHVIYLRGILGIEGGKPLVSPLWAGATDEDVLKTLGNIWEAGVEAGGFKYNAANLAMDADFSDKGSKPIGINSKKAENALRMLSAVFGVTISKSEAEKLDKVGKIVELVKTKLTQKPDPIPSGASLVRHFLLLQLRAEEGALAALTTVRDRAINDAKRRATSGGGGMSAEEMDAMKTEMRDEFAVALAERDTAFQNAARESLIAIARAHGVDLTSANLPELAFTRSGEVVLANQLVLLDQAQRLANVTEAVSDEFMDGVQPSYNPAREYGFGDVAKSGTEGQLFRFVSDLRTGVLENPDYLRERISVLGNQFDAIRLDHARGLRAQLTDPGEIAVMDRLIARGEYVLAHGPQFDGVIGVRSAYHRPIYGTKGTELVDRGRSLDENLAAYGEAGIEAESISNLAALIKTGADLRGMDFVVSAATGSIGAAIAGDLMRLGGRVIVLDYRGRSARNRDGQGFRGDFYRTLRNENAIAGLGYDQLVVEPYFNQGSDQDLDKLVTHMWEKGYRIRGFFHTAAVSDYGPVEEKGRPYDMDRVHVEFPLALEKKLAVWYRDHEADLKQEFFTKNKAQFHDTPVSALPAHLQAKYAKQGASVPAMLCEQGDGTTTLLPLDEAFWYIFVSERVPTPNNRHQLTGSGNYERKEGAGPGASSEVLYAEGVRWSNGDPIEIEDQTRTGAVYPDKGLSPSPITNAEDDKKHLMEDAARSQLGFEEVARDGYGVPFYGMQPSEAGGMIVANKIALLVQGPRVYRQAPRVVDGRTVTPLPVLTREHDMTAGFRGLEAATKARGETVGSFGQAVAAREAQRHEMAARFAVAASTDAVHLPLDGSTNDLNHAVFEQTVIEGVTEGPFAARSTDIYPQDHTMVTIGHAATTTGGTTTNAGARYRIARTDTIGFTPEMGWLATPDLRDQAIGIGLPVEGLSYEQISDQHGGTIRRKTGAQKLPEANRFEFDVQVDIGRVEFEEGDMEKARAYVAAGAKMYPGENGKVKIVFPAGTRVGVRAVTQLPTDIVVDLPGGADDFRYGAYGITNEIDLARGSYAKMGGTIAEGGAYATAGETPTSLNEQYGRERRNSLKTLAGPEGSSNKEMIREPIRNGEVSGDAMASHLVDGWRGQASIDDTGTDYTGDGLVLPGACSSGNIADWQASQQVKAALYTVSMNPGADLALVPAVTDIGNADNFGSYYGIVAFLAAKALMTYDKGAEVDLSPNQWSRPNDLIVGGFVPGRGMADVLLQPAMFAGGRLYRTGTIGHGGNPPDGRDPAPREAYGQGLLLAGFRAWAEARSQIPGATDREKMDNIELVVQGHKTSTPLGDGFEETVENFFLQYAGVESTAAFYTPGHPYYLGYNGMIGNQLSCRHGFEAMVADLVGAKGIPGIKALDAFLQAKLPPEVLATLGRNPQDPAYHSESKTDLGHLLGAHSLYDKAEVQVLAAHDIVIGNSQYANLRPEAAENPFLRHHNETINLATVRGGKRRPKVFMSFAAGFSRNNTSRIEAELRRKYGSIPSAIEALSAGARQWAVERAQLRSIAEGKRLQVRNADATPFPYTDYQDLRFLHGKSESIVAHMIETGQQLDFDNILDWAVNPALTWDTEAVVKREDRAIEAGFRRIQTLAAAALAKPEFAAAKSEAVRLNIAEQPHWYLGGSEGQALETLIFDIVTGQVKHAVVVHKDNEGTGPFYNAKALKAWAATYGVTLEMANANAVIFDSSSVAFNDGITPETADWNNLTPDNIAWDKLRYNPVDQTVLKAIRKVQERTGGQPNWVIKNYIAWGAPERAPGAGKIQVPSIDPEGRLFMSTIEDVETWDSAIERTIGSMGFNHWAIIQHAIDMGMIDEEAALQVVALPFFFSGASRKIGDGAAVLFGLEQKAVLDRKGEWDSTSDLAAKASLGLLKSQIKTGKGQVTQADWQNGLNPKAMPGVYYGSKQSGLASLGIAKLIAVLATKHLRSEFGSDQPELKVEVDRQEAGAIDETYEAMKDLGTMITEWIAANPALVQTDPVTGRQYIPTEASLALLGDNVPANTLEILSQYLHPDEIAARKIESGPSPIHGGLSSVNANFQLATISEPVVFGEAGQANVTPGHAVIRYTVPVTAAGYSGVAHGGHIDGIFEAAVMAANAARPIAGFDPNRMIRSIEYSDQLAPGMEVSIEISHWPSAADTDRSVSMRIVDALGKEYATARFLAARGQPAPGGKVTNVAIPTVDGSEIRHVTIQNVSDLKPAQLQADREFGCLTHCVAAGHGHETGLQFKYAFDREQNALWGVYDPVENQAFNAQALMLAADDMAAWTGLRAAGTWGYTTDNYYIPVREVRPGERLFLVSKTPNVGETENFDVQVQVMTARGEMVGVIHAGYFANDRATLNGIKGALDAIDNAAGDTRVDATIAFLRDSMGEKTFNEYVSRARYAKAAESRGTRSPLTLLASVPQSGRSLSHMSNGRTGRTVPSGVPVPNQLRLVSGGASSPTGAQASSRFGQDLRTEADKTADMDAFRDLQSQNAGLTENFVPAPIPEVIEAETAEGTQEAANTVPPEWEAQTAAPRLDRNTLRQAQSLISANDTESLSVTAAVAVVEEDASSLGEGISDSLFDALSAVGIDADAFEDRVMRGDITSDQVAEIAAALESPELGAAEARRLIADAVGEIAAEVATGPRSFKDIQGLKSGAPSLLTRGIR